MALRTLASGLPRRLKRIAVNAVPLSHLAGVLASEPGTRLLGEPGGVVVTGLSLDSRTTRPGDLFCALAGARDDGARHVEQAVARGAVAVLGAVAPPWVPPSVPVPVPVPWLVVADARGATGLLADRFHEHPSQRLLVLAVTGTNGKTTTAAMTRSILAMEGWRAGVVGTLGFALDGAVEPLPNTTPDVLTIHRLLARLVDENARAAILEVSSHALDQRRVEQVRVDAAAFTNLSPDHLDYHRTMEAYAASKRRLFEGLARDATAVVNAEDPWTPACTRGTRARVVRFAVDGERHPRADLVARVRRLDADGASFGIVDRARRRELTVTTRLVGRHNVSNALAAAGLGLAAGVRPEAVETGLSALASVPGRLQPVDCGQPFTVLVDYAHTPDALATVLRQLRPLVRGRLIVVFGCGGDRDRAKRPLMGRAVAEGADRLVMTSDNPRGEDPEAILDEIDAGLNDEQRERTVRRVDRREAIGWALARARDGDLVLLAGKGHETTQTIGGRVAPFDDVEVAREVLWSL